MVFLGVLRGETEDVYAKIKAQTGMTFQALWDKNNAAYVAYRGGTAPQFSPFPRDAIIDEHGNILYYAKEYYPQQIMAILEKWLKKTSVVAPRDNTPSKFSLHGNYPHPFNASTSVSFSLVETGAVELDIYNLGGQNIRSLHSGVLGSGRHEIKWDGTGADGLLAPSGVYFCRIKGPQGSRTIRILLLR